MLQGAVQSCIGLGGVLSNSLFGWIAKAIGFNASFLGLAAIAVAGGTLWQLKMSETKPDENEPDKNSVAGQENAK
jgi:sugar phosphate permease